MKDPDQDASLIFHPSSARRRRPGVLAERHAQAEPRLTQCLDESWGLLGRNTREVAPTPAPTPVTVDEIEGLAILFKHKLTALQQRNAIDMIALTENNAIVRHDQARRSDVWSVWIAGGVVRHESFVFLWSKPLANAVSDRLR